MPDAGVTELKRGRGGEAAGVEVLLHQFRSVYVRASDVCEVGRAGVELSAGHIDHQRRALLKSRDAVDCPAGRHVPHPAGSGDRPGKKVRICERR